ncbi:MAG: sulfatase-like hydrolase/transferase [Proteiniphilum sp.]|nr:sulfatase-like hydrolase/transferase [Proteiniphilum sp.]
MQQSKPESGKRENILIFMTDQQRGDTVGCAPDAALNPALRAITPNIDRFAEDSVSFTSSHTVAPHCCPSRATFFTGLYPSEHNVWNNVNTSSALSRGPNPNVRFFSQMLQEAGYENHYFGKWHVSDIERPGDKGFAFDQASDVISGYPVLDNGERDYSRKEVYEWELFYSGRQVNRELPGTVHRPGYPDFVLYGNNEDPFLDGKVTDQAIGKIGELKSSDQPWCMFVGPQGPHDPYHVPEEFLALYPLENIELPVSFHDAMKDKPNLYRKSRRAFEQLSEDDHKRAIQHYLAFCSYEDYLFGELLDSLKVSGLDRNTTVIYLSDHGDYAGDHGLWCKGLPSFRGAYSIPLIIKSPGCSLHGGTKCDALVSMADLAPTILETAGLEPLTEMSGYSLMPWLQKRTTEKEFPWREFLFTQTNGNEIYGNQRMIFNHQEKYVYNGFDFDEYYNLEQDPDELINLAHPDYSGPDKLSGERRRSLFKRIWTFAREHNDGQVAAYILTGLADFGPGVIND